LTAQAELIALDQEALVIRRLQEGDRQAAAELYQWYSARLYRQAILPRLPVRELAEDVLKDTFRIALEKIGTYESKDRSIFFWLRRIAINRAIDVHRAHQRVRRQQQRHTPQETADQIMATPPPRPDRAPEVRETKAMVELSLSRLNKRYAQALRMRLLEDATREECAEALGVKVGNFDVIFHRATKAFRKGYPP
jgi:RNA polymerase sigma factor (sigma-70 family)